MNSNYYIDNEIGLLEKVIVHRPDKGIGMIIPKKAQEWLYEDIVDIDIMQHEYDYFYKILLAFLDPEALHTCFRDEEKGYRHNDMYASSKVLDIQDVLARLLQHEALKTKIVASICGIEGCSFAIQQQLLNELPGQSALNAYELAEVLLSGILHYEENGKKTEKFIFPPIPNFVFTRDIGIMINDCFLLSKTAKQARARESVLVKYIAFYGLFHDNPDKIIEIADDDELFLLDEQEKSNQKITLEGGDVMMVAPGHLLVGCSERTSANGINKVIDHFLETPDSGIYKISVVALPHRREVMHIDTVLTPVKRNLWVIYDVFEKSMHNQAFYPVQKQGSDHDFPVTQYRLTPDGNISTCNYTSLKSLLIDISVDDFGCKKEEVQFVEGGDGIFPFNEREQWTDACNLLAVQEGVVIGYDRNYKTIESFRRKGFKIIHAVSFIEKLRKGEKPEDHIAGDTLIVLPSSELSRARGGSHCMSMPLKRSKIV